MFLPPCQEWSINQVKYSTKFSVTMFDRKYFGVNVILHLYQMKTCSTGIFNARFWFITLQVCINVSMFSPIQWSIYWLHHFQARKQVLHTIIDLCETFYQSILVTQNTPVITSRSLKKVPDKVFFVNVHSYDVKICWSQICSCYIK